MFYFIVAVLIILYYFFRAPKTIKNTLSMILLVGLLALLIVLAGMTFMKILQSPPELFIVLGMLGLAYLTLRDIKNLSEK
ncbi:MULTISPECIES: DUF3165 family protein [Streptococcus]|uniref:DUF3165 family protein n=1 Tax=Streptococcus caledonicus TaxID=2614158 RepID=A0ABW0UB65_9STRE|nr:DUF3165 family protein [Streptococcus sp. S784/96/1]